MQKEEKMQEPLLKNSHEIEIGQKVRVLDKEVIEAWNAMYDEQVKHLLGIISEIDGHDIRVHIQPDSAFGYYWNIDFSVKW